MLALGLWMTGASSQLGGACSGAGSPGYTGSGSVFWFLFQRLLQGVVTTVCLKRCASSRHGWHAKDCAHLA